MKVIAIKIKLKNLKINGLGFIALTIMLAGLLFMSINLYKFTFGFYVYHTTSKNNLYQLNVEENLTKEYFGFYHGLNDVFSVYDTAFYTNNGRLALDNVREVITSNNVKPVKDQPLYKERPMIGEELGALYIPKLKSTLPIYHGTNEDELKKGVGHYAQSVLPGEEDNSVLSGHRDTVFRKLGEIGKGDSLIVQTSAGEFHYIVNKVRIVDEDDRTVIVPKPRATLTVSTCYPFNFIGSAPQRYILVAYLDSAVIY